MQAQLKAVLQKRTRRTLGKILGAAEQDLYRGVPRANQERFRKLVLDALNDYEGMVLDIVEGLDTGEVTLNELWLTKLDDIWNTVVANGQRDQRDIVDVGGS